jgi:hypothetical protein
MKTLLAASSNTVCNEKGMDWRVLMTGLSMGS